MGLAERRLQQGWSQENLAEQAGLSVRTIQRIEAGHAASLESLKCLAAVFETSVTQLMEETRMVPEDAAEHAHPLASAMEREALEYVQNLKGLYIHLLIFAILIPCLAVLNLVISPQSLWIIWVIVPWLMAIGLQAAMTFGWSRVLGPDWEYRTFQQRLALIQGQRRRAEPQASAPRSDQPDATADQ